MDKRGILVFFILALLLTTVGGAYYLYVSERESYFVDRNFRILALWSKKVSETVEEYKYHFQYLTSAFLDDKGRFEKEFENLNQKLEGKLISISICKKSKELRPNTSVNDQPRVNLQLSSKHKDLLHLTYEREREEAKQVCKDSVCSYDHHNRSETEESKWACKDTIEVDLSISKLIRHLITDQAFNDTIITEQAFSDVIVFDSETGTVHFQANHFQGNHSSFRVDDFQDLVTQRSDTEVLFSFFSDNSESKDGRKDKTGSSTPPLKDLLQNPTHRQIAIGDISYELFTQPIVLPQLTLDKQTHYRKTKDGPARLILAGLVKTEKFQSEYRTIPHTSLLFFLLFVLLGLLSLPILHLGFMDDRERLSRIHVLSLLVACMAGTALITLLFLDVVWLNNIRASLDIQLKETTEGIKAVFEDELKKNLGLLRAYDDSYDFEDDFTCVTKSEKCPVSYFTYPHTCAEKGNRKCGEGPNGKWVARRNLCNEKDKEKFLDACDYDVVFWVDSDKNSRVNWTTKSEYYAATSRVSLAHREYVNKILDSDPQSSLWHTQDGYPFYVQPLHSLGTGKHMVVFSMASVHREQGEPSEEKLKKWVAAIETEFKSLESAVIPDGTGFAVIEDEGGKVLFHSDDDRSLWENFFEETDNNARLKAHVFSRTAGEFQGTYWGRGHSFYSTPLPDVPWSLIVFRNKELFRTINFEVLLLASALFALYTVISIIVPAALWLFNKARSRKMFMSWFWPDSNRHDWYYAYIGFIFLLFLGYILWLWFTYTSGEYAVWFPLLYPLVSLIGLWSLTKDCPKCTPKILPPKLPRHYAFAVISFLLLFSALPMGIFFKTGADREMILAMKYNLITLGHKLRQTPELDFSQIQREIRGIDAIPSPIAECSENDYWHNCTLLRHSIYLSPIAKTSLYVSDNDTKSYSHNHKELSLLERFHRRIRENSLSRLSNPVASATLGLIRDQFPGTPFRWRYEPHPSIALDFQVPLKQSHSEKQADSQSKWIILRSWPPADIWWPSSGFPAKGHFWGSIVLIVFVPMLVMVPIFIVSRIFPILPKSSTKENSNQAKRNLLIIGLNESLNTLCAERENIDCRQISDPLEWWKIKRQVLSTQKARVILKHFEYQFGMSQFDRAKLELLAAFLAKGKQICVLSTIDPLKFACDDDPTPPSSDESKSPVPVSLQEWSRIFQSFALHYASPDSRSAPVDEPYYEAIWQARTTDEKITLYHLARHGFVHAESPDLQPLFALGLIKSKPAPRLFSDDFEDYVLNAAQRDRLDTKEQERVKGHVWKWPLAIVLIVMGMGLLLTQKELHNVVVLMLSLFPVLLPTLSELIENRQGDGKVT